jgi:hypothetical protein
VDAINRTGIDRFLNYLGRVGVLANHAGATVVGFYVESIAGDVSAMLTADASKLIYINALLTQYTAEFWLQAGTVLPISPDTTQLRF